MKATVAMLVFPDLELLDLAGPLNMFATAQLITVIGIRLRRIRCVRPTAEPPVVACRVKPDTL
jgi:hypothetical protein